MKTLTWKVSITRPTACPDYQPDPYTGQYPTTHCAVYHSETVTEEKSKEFLDEESALKFAEGAPSSCYDFKLNGVAVEDKRPKLQVLSGTGSWTATNITVPTGEMGTTNISTLTNKNM